MRKIVFSEAQAGDEKKLAAFHNFDDPNLFTHEYWLYQSDKSIFIIGEEGERIIATEAFMPYELSVCGVRMLTGRSERTLVHTDYRGHDTWLKIIDFCVSRARLKGFAFAWGNTSARKPFEKAGFSFLTGHRLHLYSAVSFHCVASYLSAMRSRNAFRRSFIYEIISKKNNNALEEYAMLVSAVPSLLLRAVFSMSVSSKKIAFDVTDKPHDYADIDDLYYSLGVKEHDIYLIQSENFVEWMLYNSNNACRRYFAYVKGRLKGYIYLCFMERQVATIIDFAFEGNDIADFLLNLIYAELARKDVAFIKISLNVQNRVQKKYLKAFLANGFVPLYKGGSHVVLPLLYTRKDIINDMSRWYLTDLWYLLYNRKKSR